MTPDQITQQRFNEAQIRMLRSSLALKLAMSDSRYDKDTAISAAMEEMLNFINALDEAGALCKAAKVRKGEWFP